MATQCMLHCKDLTLTMLKEKARYHIFFPHQIDVVHSETWNTDAR